MFLNIRDISRLNWLLLGCIVVFYSTHVMHAASPNVSQLLTKAQQGFVNQEIELAEAYLTGNGVALDTALAAHWYEKAAEGGNTAAQNLVGSFYQVGIGVPVDPARALHWYQLAEASGSASAPLSIGVLYATGFGVSKDMNRASNYFHEAFDRGNGMGAAYLGIMNYLGIGAEHDVAAADRWFVAGKKLHDPDSAYNLGTLYSVSPDHTHDPVRAAKLFRQSANAGYVPAMHSLGLLLLHHPELAKSPNESLGLIESAANTGYWRSSMLLGIIARDGLIAPKDDKAAYYHFRVSILQGGAPISEFLTHDMDRLTAVLTSREVQALESDANIWFEQHHSDYNFVHVRGKTLLAMPDLSYPSDVSRAAMPFPSPAS